MANKSKNWLEYIVLFISALLVAFTLCFIIYEMIFEEQTSPDIIITYGKIEKRLGYVALPITATNKGAETAEDLRIEVIAGSGDAAETSEIQFNYLPGKSSVNGWVTFNQNPANTNLTIHILGYSSP